MVLNLMAAQHLSLKHQEVSYEGAMLAWLEG